MKLYYGTIVARTTWEGIWTYAQVRPWPIWLVRRLWLFVRLVWRKYEDHPDSTRIDFKTAWAVSKVAIGLGLCEVHRRKP